MRLRRLPVAAFAALAIAGGIAPAAAAKSAAAGPVVIVASHGQPGRMPTYPGPDGSRIPEGACAAVQGRTVLVLPCTDPRATAYRATEAQAHARAARRWRLRDVGALLLLAALVGAATEWLQHRRSLPTAL